MPAATLPSLSSPLLVEQAVDAIRERIVAGAFGPDGHLPPQGQLCRELGVSRSVIREAMQRLQSQRLIEISQGRKPRVMPAGAQGVAESLHLLMQRADASLVDLAEVRLVLETEIAALAAERISADGRTELAESITSMEHADTVDAQVEADIRFHRILAQASGNPIFVFLLDALAELLRASRRTTIGFGGIDPALEGHREILRAIERRDAAAARDAMQRHVRASLNDIREQLAREPQRVSRR